jgi:hypothetical protein
MSISTVDAEPTAIGVLVTESFINVGLEDGRQLIVPTSWYPRLTHATTAERQNWRLLGGGYAIEWPDLDEHIGVDGLLLGKHSGESDKSFHQWLEGRKKKGNGSTSAKPAKRPRRLVTAK